MRVFQIRKVVGAFPVNKATAIALAGKGLAQTGYRLNSRCTMKEGIHPNYREVLFRDMTPGVNFEFVSRSTINTKETAEYNGKEYPLVKLDTSAASHNFYTGETRIMDAEGRVDKFRKKFGTRAGGKAA